MKIIGLTSTAILTLLLAATPTPAYGQQEQHERQDHREQQQGSQDRAKPSPQRTQRQPQHAQRQQQQSQQRADQQRHDNLQHTEQQHVQQQQQHVQQQQRQDQRNQQQRAQARRPQHTPQERQRVRESAWQQHRSQNWQSDHRTWQQRGGYHGYRIPDDRYRGYFGPRHGFRINTLPFLVVGGYPRFQYQGYWISAVDPWPEYWGNDWYDNDDVYVNYVDNGYYLYNRRYPSAGVAINITL
jgi:hypothetical protein